MNHLHQKIHTNIVDQSNLSNLGGWWRCYNTLVYPHVYIESRLVAYHMVLHFGLYNILAAALCWEGMEKMVPALLERRRRSSSIDKNHGLLQLYYLMHKL